MKKITSKNLTNRLSKYGALSVAIAGVANANGQVVYTDIADVTLDGTNVSYSLDLDNDGIQDYQLRVNPSTGTPFAFIFTATSSSYNSNGIVGFSASGYNYPSNLTNGETISGASPLMPPSARGDLNFNSCAYYNSQFCDGLDGFLGFSFEISSSIHYGWVRVQVSSDATTMIVKDYAYNSVAGEAINAGQTLGIAELALNEIRIVNLNSSIALYNLPEKTEYNLYDISGKSVLNGSIKDDTFVIEANGISNGIYILELTDTFTKSVIRKKVVL